LDKVATTRRVRHDVGCEVFSECRKLVGTSPQRVSCWCIRAVRIWDMTYRLPAQLCSTMKTGRTHSALSLESTSEKRVQTTIRASLRRSPAFTLIALDAGNTTCALWKLPAELVTPKPLAVKGG